jgi:hypothetical protein
VLVLWVQSWWRLEAIPSCNNAVVVTIPHLFASCFAVSFVAGSPAFEDSCRPFRIRPNGHILLSGDKNWICLYPLKKSPE